MGDASSLSTSSLQKLQSLLSQREAAIGSTTSSATIEALLEAELKASQDIQLEREALAVSEEQFAESMALSQEQLALSERSQEASEAQFAESLAFSKEQAEEAAEAAQIQGAIDIVSTGATSYLGYKLLTKDAATPAAALATTEAPSGLGGVSLGGASSIGAIEGLSGISAEAATGLSATGTSTAAIQAPSTVTGTASASGASSTATTGFSAVGSGIAAAILVDSAIASSFNEGFDSFEERQAANLKGFEYGGISPGAAAVLDDMGIKSPLQLTKDITGFDPTFGLIDDANELLSGIPGLDFINDIFGSVGSIVCDELNRQGFISDELIQLSHEHRKHHIDNDTYKGYLKIAKPLVWLMKHSRLFIWTYFPLGLGWCLEVAHIMNPKKYPKGCIVGKFLMKFVVPICRLVGKYNG